MMLCRDVSNFTDTITAATIASWKAQGVGLVIIQAFPPSYAQYTEQRAQMRVCAAEGMPFDCYIYDYLGAPDWLWGALDGLDQLLLPSEKPRQLFLDEEDTETERGWSAQQRAAAISNSIGSIKQRGYRCGIYSADWWWTPKMGGFRGFSDYSLWAAQYDGVADASVFTPFGGWQSCRIKQYAGSQPDGTDLNVLSAEEEAELTQPTSDCSEVTAQRDGLINSLGYIAGDLLAPVAKQKTSTVALRRLVAGIRAQAEQQGIAHA